MSKEKIVWIHVLIEVAKRMKLVDCKSPEYSKTLKKVIKDLGYKSKSKDIMEDSKIRFLDHTSYKYGLNIFDRKEALIYKLKDEYIGLSAVDIIKEAKNNKISTPTVKLVEKYLKYWKKDKRMLLYREQEEFLIKFFKKYYKNNSVDNIIIKSLMLDKFYSTQIRNPVEIARGISKIKDIDNRLKKGDITLVKEIASTGTRNEYSFATKYCSFHNPKKFPIYDQFVRKILHYFESEYSKEKLTHKKLENYNIFVNAIYDFIKHYKLEKYSIKEIDIFLWLLGKENFKEIK